MPSTIKNVRRVGAGSAVGTVLAKFPYTGGVVYDLVAGEEVAVCVVDGDIDACGSREVREGQEREGEKREEGKRLGQAPIRAVCEGSSISTFEILCHTTRLLCKFQCGVS